MSEFGVNVVCMSLIAAAMECKTHQVRVEYAPHVRWIVVEVSEGAPGDASDLPPFFKRRIRLGDDDSVAQLDNTIKWIQELANDTARVGET